MNTAQKLRQLSNQIDQLKLQYFSLTEDCKYVEYSSFNTEYKTFSLDTIDYLIDHDVFPDHENDDYFSRFLYKNDDSLYLIVKTLITHNKQPMMINNDDITDEDGYDYCPADDAWLLIVKHHSVMDEEMFERICDLYFTDTIVNYQLIIQLLKQYEESDIHCDKS